MYIEQKMSPKRIYISQLNLFASYIMNSMIEMIQYIDRNEIDKNLEEVFGYYIFMFNGRNKSHRVFISSLSIYYKGEMQN